MLDQRGHVVAVKLLASVGFLLRSGIYEEDCRFLAFKVALDVTISCHALLLCGFEPAIAPLIFLELHRALHLLLVSFARALDAFLMVRFDGERHRVGQLLLIGLLLPLMLGGDFIALDS